MLVALAVSLSACAKDSGSSSTTSVTKQTTPVGEVSYEAYYKKFLFAAGICSANYPRYYHFASSHNISSLASDRNLNVSVTLYLLTDNTYTAYLEILKPRPDISSNTSEILETDQQSGKWSVVDENLILENLGVGTALTFNGQPAIDLKLQDVASGIVFNQSETIVGGSSSSSVPQQFEVQCK